MRILEGFTLHITAVLLGLIVYVCLMTVVINQQLNAVRKSKHSVIRSVERNE